MRILSLDSETTGLDLYHGARPYLVTMYDPEQFGGEPVFWEWPVDPLTRTVKPVKKEMREIQATINDAEVLVLQNAKFDYGMLRELWRDHGMKLEWDWSKVVDTLYCGHLLASNHPHGLTSMMMEYLETDVQPYEDRMKEVVIEARKWAKKNRPDWRLAKAGLPEMPSAKGGKGGSRGAESKEPWKYDCWIAVQVANEQKLPADHTYRTVTYEYANSDSVSTWYLWQAMEGVVKDRKLRCIYNARLKVIPSICTIEKRGVTFSLKRLEELKMHFSQTSEVCLRRCIALSDNTLDKLPKNGTSNALKAVLFDKFNLISSKTTPKGQPSVDKSVLETWLNTLPPRSVAYVFISNLKDYRRRQTALGYIESYLKYCLPYHDAKGFRYRDWKVLHPSVNATGTDTLRFSSSNPNSQQFSKQEIMLKNALDESHSLRYVLGPAPGREWWSMDAENIELRLPAYEAGETAMIELFERPNDPPYYGSNHLFFFSILHPKMWDKYGAKVKKKFADSWYQWTKNGDFAVQYGAVASSGTADRAYHVPGAQAIIEEKLQNIKALGDRMIKFAEEHGYVETMPDKTVDKNRGYPLLVTRNRWGTGVAPTLPLNYHVQGSAMWWMCKAMIRCHEFLKKHNIDCKLQYHAYMIMQVHDELVFDFPKSKSKLPFGKYKGYPSNYSYVMRLKRLMEKGGDDLGVPTTVSVDFHPNNWGETVSLP